MIDLKGEMIEYLLGLNKETYTISDFDGRYNNEDQDFIYAFNSLVDERKFTSIHDRNLKVTFSADGKPNITAHQFIIH
ncbi:MULTISPECIES: hypothetical protein [Pseudoalteromonas]|uniref:hypothetical protein n=1 Tax=Pseudoalteromonas TaxID=53246 RepID=UPI000579DAFC|nr:MULTISPECIES: hypothetical protein [Pseudoalteromonas]ATG57897.1 hypothetical protein CPA52_06485 [Pseudoalteromonas marina]